MLQALTDLSLCSLGLYLTSLWGEFLFDDITGFSVDKKIMSGEWKKLLPGHWRTLVHLSYAWCVKLNMKVFNFAAHPFFLHLGNVQLHAVNGLILFGMLRNLGYSERESLAGALIFVAHPLCVNAVANISGRSSVLSGTFYFLALAFAASNHFGLALICMLPALWSKEDTITLPLVLGTMAFMQNHPAWWVFFVCPLMVVLFLHKRILHVRKRTGSEQMIALGFEKPLEPEDYHFTTAVETIVKYPRWLLGFGQNIDHQIQPVKDERKTALACGILTLTGMLAYAVPELRLPLLLMAVSPLLVYWFIVLPDPIAEHRAYISLAGVSILGAQLYSSFPWFVWAAFFFYFFLRAIYRQHAWTDGVRLWAQAYKDGSNTKIRVLSNLNWAYQKNGDLRSGEFWAREALKLKPDVFPVRYNLSRIAEDCGKLPEAIQIMEETMQLTPNVWQGWKRLGQLYEMTGQLDKALPPYMRVLDFQKLGDDTTDQKADTLNQIGSIHFRNFINGGKKDKVKLETAVKYFNEAHGRDPKNHAIMYNLGMAAAVSNDKPKAKEWLEKLGPNAPVPQELKELCAAGR